MTHGMSAPLGRTIGPQGSATTGSVFIDTSGYAGAWTLHGPSGTNAGSGDTLLTGMATGAYWIAFTAASGYVTPTTKYGDLAEDETLTLLGTYTATVSTTPDGFVSTPVDTLRNLIAESTTFQAWTGNPADATTAKTYIFPFVLKNPANNVVQCVVSYAPGLRFSKVAGGEGNVYNVSGPLRALFQAPIDSTLIDNETAAAYDFANRIGNILEEIQDLSDTDGHINLVEMELVDPPARSTYEEQGAENDYFECFVDFVYGV